MKAILALGLALTGFFGGVSAHAGVAVDPGVRVTCNTHDHIMGPVSINFQNGVNSVITTIVVRSNQTGETLRNYQGSGSLTWQGTGHVSFITVQGLPAHYILFQDGNRTLWAQFTLNGRPGNSFQCYLN